MKIHYSPYFEGEHYIDLYKRENVMIGEMVAGNSGLLREIELRCGLGCDCLSEIERQANYYRAVKATMENDPDCLFGRSFSVDEYGVSAKLLRWRDELVTAGWTSGIRGISAKLDIISDIERNSVEQNLIIKGESDRWQTVLKNDLAMLDRDIRLDVHFPKEYLPPHIFALIDKLCRLGITCTFVSHDKPIAQNGNNLYKIQKALLKNEHQDLDKEGDDSFRILRFTRHGSAMEWIASNPFTNDMVFINSNNHSFDYVQGLFCKPASGSFLTDANPELVQIFKLGCLLFVRPFDIYNLLSYLQISKHPLPWKLRQALIDVIISEGGIVNPKWEEVIREFVKEKGDNRQLIGRYLPLPDINGGEIEIESLREFVRAMGTWASKALILLNDDEQNTLIRQQFAAVVGLCNAFRTILTGQNEKTVTSERVRSWILSIYKPSNYRGSVPSKGSRLVISSPAAFADDASDVTWMDFFNEEPSATVHQFLNADEKRKLVENGILIWSDELQLKSQLHSYKLGVLSCKSKLTLVVSENDKGERLNAHPLAIHLYALLPDIRKLEIANPAPGGESVEIEPAPLPEIPAMVRMEGDNLFTPREVESYSSLQTLIQNPLDYVLRYQAGLSQSSVEELNDCQRTMGNVAHLLIQILANDSGNDLRRMRQLFDTGFDAKISDPVTQNGAILLLDSNKILLMRFRNQLRKSVNNLLSILENNGLSVVGCEHVLSSEVPDLTAVEARIDLLTANAEGNYFIFDLKWTSSKSYYQKLIKENRALQLEIYRKVLGMADIDHPVMGVGYFDLANGILETSFSFGNWEFIRITSPDNDADIIGQATRAYHYRWDQLHDGIIEVAEGLELSGLDYHNDTADKDLYPLEKDYNNKELKAVNRFSDFKTFKGGLK